MAMAAIPTILATVVPMILPYVMRYFQKQGQHVEQESIELRISKELESRLTRLTPFELDQIIKYIGKLKLEGIPTHDWMQRLIARFPHFSDAIVAIVSGVNAQDVVKIGKRYVEPEKSEQYLTTEEYTKEEFMLDRLDQAHSDENDAISFYTKIIDEAKKMSGPMGNIIADKFTEIRKDEMDHRKIISALHDLWMTKQETLK